jgi:CrcB protein
MIVIAPPMARFLWVCFAGAIGTGLRYIVGLAARRVLGSAFPWGTLAVNVIGCFLFSVVAYAGAKRLISPGTWVTLATGFLGGLTTYSAFNGETLAFAREGAWAMGLFNALGTFAGCVAAGLLGLALARAMLG